jgi:2,3-bisphosphoglycerate-dependent phosphoglycerate mutase
MNLENISEHDIIDLNLPRAVPLAYRLDENFQPVSRADGKLDEATGFLRGEWLGGDGAVKEILARDHRQVYDITIEKNLEIGREQDKWRKWMEFSIGKAQPEMNVTSSESGDFIGDYHDSPQKVVSGK